MADSRWSLNKNEEFFKLHTLKHATQSCKASEKRKLKKESRLPENIENNDTESQEPTSSEVHSCDIADETDRAIENLKSN